MSKLPKLKVKRTWDPVEEIRDFEQAQYFLFSHGADVIVEVEGQVVKSYGELLQLASQDRYKGREFLEVSLSPVVIAGG